MNATMKFGVLTLLGLVTAAHAEIDGSGFHGENCTGAITSTFWIEGGASGVGDGIGNPLADIEVILTMAGAPELGADEFATNEQGVVEFTHLCSGIYDVRVDPNSLPADARFIGVVDVNASDGTWNSSNKLVPIQVLVASDDRSVYMHRELRFIFTPLACPLDLEEHCDMTDQLFDSSEYYNRF